MPARRRFNASLSISIVLHVLVALYFLRKIIPPNVSKKGVVAIDFIMPVTHEETSRPGGVAREETLRNQSVQARPAPPLASPPPRPIGDPQAVARESDRFIAEIAALIDRTKIYPPEAVDREEEGKVLVALTLGRDGTLMEVKIERPCPFDSLNAAALRSVRKITKFPSVPDILSSPVHLHVPLTFKIER